MKDATGTAWVWIDEHKVEIAVAAAVIAVVAAGLIIAPDGQPFEGEFLGVSSGE